MKIILIQLSDIHAKSVSNYFSKKQEKICMAIRNHALEAECIFVVVTGDIAFSGLPTEYEVAKSLLDYIKSEIEAYTKKSVDIVLVPGNHDCDLQTQNTFVREKLISDIEKNREQKIHTTIVEQCCAPQEQYRDFARGFHSKGNVVFDDTLCTVLKYDFDGHYVIFHCYNTAWLSEKPEQPGKLHFPTKHFPDEYRGLKASLVVGVLHHPFGWHSPESARNLSNHLQSTAQIILTGHDHVATCEIKDNLEGTFTEYIEGPCLINEEDDTDSGFNIVQIDLGIQKQRVIHYKWNGEYYDIFKDTGYIGCHSLLLKHNGSFQKADNFVREFLEDVGAQLRHSQKPKLTLEDVFVFPDIKNVTPNREHLTRGHLAIKRSSLLLELKETNNKFLLIGAERAGKTALCKRLFQSYYSKGYIPIYINGDDVKSTAIDKFTRDVEQKFLEQYTEKAIEKYRQYDNNKKFLIIDDFDRIHGAKARALLLGAINARYPNVFLTGNDLFQIAEMVVDDGGGLDPVKDYEQFVLMQFGHERRAELITKWNTLGAEELEEAHAIRLDHETKRVVDTIIGKNLVPAYPLFLLMILQAMEMGYSHNLEESSYGHYYQILIGEAIRGVVVRNDKIDAYYNFLEEFSFFLFNNKVREISREIFNEFHKSYCNDHKVSSVFVELVNPQTLIINLEKAGIFNAINGRVRFKYKYDYFFFIAKYLADNIEKEEIKEIISEITKRLYVEDFANTIMFLTHHSKNPFIMDEVIKGARQVFGGCHPVHFEQDISVVNGLLQEVPRLVLKALDVRKHREEIDKEKDKREIEAREDDEPDRADLDFKQSVVHLDLISELNLTFKTLEILGQILRNYHTSLKGDLRFTIAEEAYLLGLRSLQPFFEILRSDESHIISTIANIVQKEKSVDAEKVEIMARRILFHVCRLVSFVFIKKIAESVGSEYLSETYKDILEKQDFNSVHMIDLAIKLGFFEDFPIGELDFVKKRVEKSPLPYTVVKDMVIDHLYMFPTKFKVKQSICNLLDIPMLDQRLIDVSSTQKKR